MTVALFAGVVIAVAQSVPMVQLPQYFAIVDRFGPVFGMLAVAPLFLGLVVAGPIAGYLLSRFTPRVLVAAGLVVVGIGNLGVALLAGPGTGYVLYVLPLLLIGAGFVVGTTVRTAIIFASVPRGLPATAAALNEASIALGNRIGIVLVTAIVAGVSLASYDAAHAGAAGAGLRDEFADLLYAVGTPSFPALAGAVRPEDVAGYLDAYVVGVRTALALGGSPRCSAGWSCGCCSANAIRWRPAAPTRWARCTSTGTSAPRRRPEPAPVGSDTPPMSETTPGTGLHIERLAAGEAARRWWS